MLSILRQAKQTLNFILTGQTTTQQTAINTFSPAPNKSSAYSDGVIPFSPAMCIVLIILPDIGPEGALALRLIGSVVVGGGFVPVLGFAYGTYAWKTYFGAKRQQAAAEKAASEAQASSTGKSDVASSWDMNFQTPATDIMEKIVDLHHDLMFFLIVIVLFVSWVLARMIGSYQSTSAVTPRVAFAHHTLLEKIWTYIPAGILVLIASPSFSLLYSIDALTEPQISVKVIGHQWYWSYETTDLVSAKDINFDSYMALEADLPTGGLRLLEVDNRLALPIRTNIRLIITAADVLHSWALPALGVKMDACPGRLNQVSLHLNRSGVFYGQCSELCGINHSFMPIVVDAVTREQYRRWLDSQS